MRESTVVNRRGEFFLKSVKRTAPSVLFWMMIFFIGGVSGCRPLAVGLHPSSGPADNTVYSRADAAFQSGDYETVLDLYRRHQLEFPHRALGPPDLLLLGSVHAIRGEYDEARSVYENIIRQYKGTVFELEARLEMLSIFLREGRYRDIVQQAEALTETGVYPSLDVRKYTLIGDAWLSMGRPVEAINAFAMAREKADPSGQRDISGKLTAALEQMDAEQLRGLLGSVSDRRLLGDMLLQSAFRHAKNNRYDLAIRTIQEFAANYPDHEAQADVPRWLEEFGGRSEFDRNSIGCLLPLSGRFEPFGIRALRGIELALIESNERAYNPDLRIVVRDTASDPGITVTGVKELHGENVAAIIGPLSTAEVAAKEACALNIPLIAFTQHYATASIGDTIFTTFLTPEMQVRILVAYAMRELGLTRFAVLYPSERYGETFMNLFREEVLRNDGRIVAMEAYDPTGADFAHAIKRLAVYAPPLSELPDRVSLEKAQAVVKDVQEVAKIENKHEETMEFEALFIPDGVEKAGLILPQLTYHDVRNVYLLGTNLWHSPSLIEMAGPYAQGAIFPDIFFPDSTSPRVSAFVRHFQSVYGYTPGFMESMAYDTAGMLFDIVGRPQVRSIRDIIDAIRSPDGYPGVSGDTWFTPEGEAVKKLYLIEIRGNRFVELNYEGFRSSP